jgi:hypothetical protein
VIGIEPDDAVCEQCGATGKVYLIGDKGVASHALHEECARFYYRRGRAD